MLTFHQKNKLIAKLMQLNHWLGYQTVEWYIVAENCTEGQRARFYHLFYTATQTRDLKEKRLAGLEINKMALQIIDRASKKLTQQNVRA